MDADRQQVPYNGEEGDTMPKKSDSLHENRGHSDQKEDRGHRGGKMDDFRQQGRQDGSGKRDDFLQQGRQDGSGKRDDFLQQNQEAGPGNLGGTGGFQKLFRQNRKLFQGNKPGAGLGAGTAKNGCLPGCLSRLFMLAVPFIALGTYLLVRS